MTAFEKNLTVLKRYFRKFRELPLKVLIYKLKRRIRLYFYYRKRRRYSGGTFLELDKGSFMSFKTECRCFFDHVRREEYADMVRSMGLEEEIIDDAERISSHIFNFLGSGDVMLPGRIPWNRDFKSGFEWKNCFYKDIRIIDLSNTADVKVPWELSRFQHLFTLGKAYWLTKDEKYAEEFGSQIEDWIECNPIENSVNWTCTMDVAIRAVNLIIGWFMFGHSSSLDPDFWAGFNRSLFLHGRFIIKNLEDSEQYKNNHYLSDIVGLVWLGVYFKGFEPGDKYKKNGPDKWLAFGLDKLKKEAMIQVNSDGTDYEAATGYHRLVSEMLLYTALFCEKNGIRFDESCMKRIYKMCVFIQDIVKPNGLSPLIGDMDDGRFIITSRYYSWERRDFRHILAVAGELFGNQEFKSYSADFAEDALFCRKEISNDSGRAVKAYKNGGYYIFRDKELYLIIHCGELSCRGAGNHSHNDQLSFELNYKGEDFIVDPGVYTYTSDYKMKKLFRSTRFHNTLCLEGYEQNDFNNDEIFDLREQTFASCTKIEDGTFEGIHSGYKQKCGIIHKRKFTLQNAQVNILDHLIYDRQGSKKPSSYCVFNLDKDVEASISGKRIRLTKKGKEIEMSVEGSNIRIEEGLVSYGYGKLEKSLKIIAENGGSCEIATSISLL